METSNEIRKWPKKPAEKFFLAEMNVEVIKGRDSPFVWKQPEKP